MAVKVEKPDDWSEIAGIGGPVVDPMIMRCGEVFLRGRIGAIDEWGARDLLLQNVHALGTFFDRLILDEKIPIFNYADTFDIGQNFDTRTLGHVNNREEILVDVDVTYMEYERVKLAAVAELSKLYESGERGVNAQDAYSILGELNTSGYAWYPRADGLPLPNQDEERLAGYILGGLIFGGYAQLAGVDHLMQPKRSRLFLAVSLRQPAGRTAEGYLFENLRELTRRQADDVPFTPTFLPMLLKESAGPADLLANALKLRGSGEVRDYRSWLREALNDFDANGFISIERAREVDRIAEAIRNRIEGSPRVELKIAIVGEIRPEASIDLTETVRAAWGWVIGLLPGNRHRKLLTRATIADLEYIEIERRIQTVWNGPALPI